MRPLEQLLRQHVPAREVSLPEAREAVAAGFPDHDLSVAAVNTLVQKAALPLKGRALALELLLEAARQGAGARHHVVTTAAQALALIEAPVAHQHVQSLLKGRLEHPLAQMTALGSLLERADVESRALVVRVAKSHPDARVQEHARRLIDAVLSGTPSEGYLRVRIQFTPELRIPVPDRATRALLASAPSSKR